MSAKYPLLTICIGNTHTSMAQWRDWRFETWKTGAVFPRQAEAILNQGLRGDVKILIAGVVPKERPRVCNWLKKWNASPHLYRRDFSAGIQIIPKPAEKVGDDRLLGALGALSIEPSRPWVVVDTGTAMTVNAVRPGNRSRLPRFEGGLIVPGAQLSLNVLGAGTAQLPVLKFLPSFKSDFIGRNTAQAIQYGVFQAQLATAIALAEGQLKILGARAHVMLTGGLANFAKFRIPFINAFGAKRVSICGTELLHFGLAEAWRRNAKHG